MTQRKGQYLFNVMLQIYPEAVEKLRATEYDPFHYDERCIDFLKELIRIEEE